MDPSNDVRRKRVLYRSHHTGMKENDILVGAFTDQHLHELSDEEVAWLEWMLATVEDIDLHHWLMGNKPVPETFDHPVMQRLLNFKLNR